MATSGEWIRGLECIVVGPKGGSSPNAAHHLSQSASNSRFSGSPSSHWTCDVPQNPKKLSSSRKPTLNLGWCIETVERTAKPAEGDALLLKAHGACEAVETKVDIKCGLGGCEAIEGGDVRGLLGHPH